MTSCDLGWLINLSLEERSRLDREVEIEEVEEVIKKLARRKSPGLDGIPNEFYQSLG